MASVAPNGPMPSTGPAHVGRKAAPAYYRAACGERVQLRPMLGAFKNATAALKH